MMPKKAAHCSGVINDGLGDSRGRLEVCFCSCSIGLFVTCNLPWPESQGACYTTSTPRVCAPVVPSHSARQAVEILAEARACLRWHPLCTYVIDFLPTNYR